MRRSTALLAVAALATGLLAALPGTATAVPATPAASPWTAAHHTPQPGGVPGATGYQAVVTLTGADGSVLSKTFPVLSDTWTPLSVPLSGWSGAAAVRRIEVGFSAVGTAYSPWGGNFQLDDVAWG